MLPRRADISKDRSARNLLNDALKPCLSKQPLSSTKRRAIERRWPGLIGKLKGDVRIHKECDRLRRGELVLMSSPPRKTSRVVIRPNWLWDLQRGVNCDLVGLRAMLDIEYARSLQQRNMRHYQRSAARAEAGGLTDPSQTDILGHKNPPTADNVNEKAINAGTKNNLVYAKARTICANSVKLTTREIRSYKNRYRGAIRQRDPADGGKHPELCCQDVERAFPEKALGLVNKVRSIQA